MERLARLAAVLALVLVVAPPAARAQQASPVSIDNGTIELGVTPSGHLGMFEGDVSKGLGYLPDGSTALGYGDDYWGAGNDGSTSNETLFGYPVPIASSGSNGRVVSFTSDDRTATSVMELSRVYPQDFSKPGMLVTHAYHPVTETPNLYALDVTFQNLTDEALDDVRYRREPSWWLSEAVPRNRYFQTHAGTPAPVAVSGNNWLTAYPLTAWGTIDPNGPGSAPAWARKGPFTDVAAAGDPQPQDQASRVDIAIGTIQPGDSSVIRLYLGAAATEAGALSAIDAVGAEWFALAQPEADGAKGTFVLAFDGDVETGGLRSASAKGLTLDTRAPERLRLPGPFGVTAELRNGANADATDVTTRIEPGPGLAIASGAPSQPAGGPVPPDGTADAAWQLEPASDAACQPDLAYEVITTFTGPGGGGTIRVPREVDVLGCGGIEGTVKRRTIDGDNPPFDTSSELTACPKTGPAPCRTVETGDDGLYRFRDLPPGDYRVESRPPGSEGDLAPQVIDPVMVTEGATTSAHFLIEDLEPPPPTVVDIDTGPADQDGTPTGDQTDAGTGDDGIPFVFFANGLTIRDKPVPAGQCAYSRGTWEVIQGVGDDITVIASGDMVRDRTDAQVWIATIPPLRPYHGYARIRMMYFGSCEDGSVIPAPGEQPPSTRVDLYIDPSGYVRDLAGAPIPGATVTLLRADRAGGPFTVVPDGSTIMSPTNRTNPDTTDAAGHFRWDVVAGFYKLRVQKAGCTAPGGGEVAESPVYAIPPPVTDALVQLDCLDPDPRPEPTPDPPGPGPAAPATPAAPGVPVTPVTPVTPTTCTPRLALARTAARRDRRGRFALRLAAAGCAARAKVSVRAGKRRLGSKTIALGASATTVRLRLPKTLRKRKKVVLRLRVTAPGASPLTAKVTVRRRS